MKKLSIVFALACACTFGQTTPAATNYVAAGFSYQPGASPALAGTGIYGRFTQGSTFAFTVVDVLPMSVKPFTVVFNPAVGVAAKVLQINSVSIYVPTSVGPSVSGTNTGWNWSAGALIDIPIKKTGWHVNPVVRAVKSSVNGYSGYQIIGGAMVGWGW